MGPDKKRLSKQHGATSVMDYPRQGYIPEGMTNFLTLLGWSPSSDEELFTAEDLVQLRLPDEELLTRLVPLLEAERTRLVTD